MRKHCALRSETELNKKDHPVPRNDAKREPQATTTRTESLLAHGHAQTHTTTS